MKKNLNVFIQGILMLITVFTLICCGKVSNAPAGAVSVQSAPLAGSSAASLGRGFSTFAFRMLENLLGEQLANAAVSTFTAFKACNDTLTFIDSSGNQVTVNGSQNPSVGRGLLTFSPTGTSAMAIGSLNLPAGTTLSEVDITFAVAPSVCGGANYAVEFDPGTGPIDITQNTAFKFKYSSPVTITGNAQTISLQFGSIVTAMVSKGAALSNSTIQTINVGQAL